MQLSGCIEGNKNKINKKLDKNNKRLYKDGLKSLDVPTEFDYLKFMSYYNLKTMTNEIMVNEEYYNLANIV